ncbi:MAG: PorV/PorQ family protein [candidate division KSB1 bacterium]|nr:PorV/PorQ family protein [candidate division KSB1 bacterium]
MEPSRATYAENRIETAFTHRPSIVQDIFNFEHFALAYQLGTRSTLAAYYTYVDYGYVADLPDHSYNYTLGATYAAQINQELSAGLTLKRVSQELLQSTAHSLAVDLGVLYQWQDFLRAQACQSQMNFGVSLSNLGQKAEFFEGQADPLPQFLRVGLASNLKSSATWAETGLSRAGVLISFEYQKLLNDEEKIWEWGTGIEAQFLEMMHFRLGYHKRFPQINRTAIGKTFETGATYGFGFDIPFHEVFKIAAPLTFQFDFASAPQGGWVERYEMFTFAMGFGSRP